MSTSTRQMIGSVTETQFASRSPLSHRSDSCTHALNNNTTTTSC